MTSRVCVVGAGAIGLSAALSIKRAFPSLPVTIVAQAFLDETTSHGAGGYFRAKLSECHYEDKDAARRWIKESWDFFNGLATSAEAKESGCALVPAVMACETDEEEAYAELAKLVYGFRRLSQKEMEMRGLHRDYMCAFAYTTVVSEPPKFLRWLMRQFIKAGGKIEKKKVDRLEDLSADYDVVINCCGLGAQTLLRDKEVVPIMGQLVMLKAPWIKELFFGTNNVYCIPQSDRLVVGGVRDKGNYNTDVDPTATVTILSRAERLFPQLKGAEIESEWVGLRPFRGSVRLEMETLKCGPKGRLMVIHNYGHGGHGISFSWGCAQHVVRLLKEGLKRTQSSL